MLRLLGYLFSSIPAAAAAVSYFPVLRARGEGETALSLGAVLLLVIAALPFLHAARTFFRSPSAWKIWLALLVFFSLTERIARQMVVISAVGLLGSAVGMVCFCMARVCAERSEVEHGKKRL